jgi:penicillin-binding protein 2
MKRKNLDRTKIFNRRALFVGLLQTTGVVLLGWRLAWLQIVQGDKYKTLSDANRINIKMLSPVRGLIVDRHGKPMAENGQNFRLIVVPEQTDNLEEALTQVQKYIKLTQHDIQKVLKKARRSPKYAPLEVKDNLDWDEAARIHVNLPDLPGISIDEGEIRKYPMSNSCAHMIGYVGAVTRAEQTGDPVLNLPGFKIGKTGLEKFFDKELRGQAGAAEVEVNVSGREVRELGRKPGVPGARLQLTIDAGLQSYVQKRLSEVRSASAIVMDAHTGAVYALCSSPAFDPNVFARGLSPELWEELLADPALPLNNKAVGGQYPPGSTFKMVTAIAGLEEGVINRHTGAFCPGHYFYGDTKFHCWKKHGHGSVNVIAALQQSCDIYFYRMVTELGINRLAKYSHMFGLGEKYGFELTEERPGLVPTTDWKKANFKDSTWHAGESIVASIGQGYILTTPLQLAVMTSRFVNGGYAVEPWVAGYIGARDLSRSDWPKIPVKDEHLAMMKEGMDKVVNVPGGTAFGARIKEPGFEMGGKTGTAQVRRITAAQRAAGYRAEDLPWHHQHHALFVGYAPMDNPRYVCSVVVEHGGGGSAVAAPIARDILLETQKRNPVAVNLMPDNSVPVEEIVKPGRKPVRPDMGTR